MAVTMTLLRADRQITVLVTVGLFCLFASSRSCLVRGGSVKRGQLAEKAAPTDDGQIRTCGETTPNTIELQGASQSFRFKGPEGLELCPVEQDPTSAKSGTPAASDPAKVYTYTSAAKQGQVTCGPPVKQLDELVPDPVSSCPRSRRNLYLLTLRIATPCSHLLSVKPDLRRRASAISAVPRQRMNPPSAAKQQTAPFMLPCPKKRNKSTRQFRSPTASSPLQGQRGKGVSSQIKLLTLECPRPHCSAG